MSKRPKMSAGELDVARAVWQLQAATVGQVYDWLVQRIDIDYATVQTYLRRLEDKGYLRSRRQGRNKIYSARVQPKRVIRETVADVVDRLFDGEALAMMHHLIRDHGISEEDVDDLRKMLDQWEGQQRDD